MGRQFALPLSAVLPGTPLLHLGLREKPDRPGEEPDGLQLGWTGQVRARQSGEALLDERNGVRPGDLGRRDVEEPRVPQIQCVALAGDREQPVGLCRELASRGFKIARYDQRDAGQSTRMPDAGGSNPFVALARKRGAYTSEDMTDGAIAVLDALGWKQAHIVGASLGGIIAQRIALRHPERVLSVVSAAGLPSDASGLGAGRYARFGLLAKLARAKVPEGREGDVQLSLMLARAVASPAYPFDEDAAREWLDREIDSGPRDTKAQSRQVGAAWHGPKLRELRKPVLVLHGDQDPLLRVSAARATAKVIDGARLVILPGAGHDLPAPLWPTIADEIRQLADRAHAAAAAGS